MNNFLLSNETWGVSNSARVYLAKNTGSVYSTKDNDKSKKVVVIKNNKKQMIMIMVKVIVKQIMI